MKKFLLVALFASCSVLFAADNKTVIIGSEVVISVTAKGTQPFVYQWYKNGQGVVGATSQTLVFKNITTADAGTYSVAVANSAGGTQSDNAVLVVTIAPATSATVSITVTRSGP